MRFNYIFIWVLTLIFDIIFQSYVTFYLFIIMSIFPIITLIFMHTGKRMITLAITSRKEEFYKNQPIDFGFEYQGLSLFPIATLETDIHIKNRFYIEEEIQELSFFCGEKESNYPVSFHSSDSGVIEVSITTFKLHDLLGFWRRKIKYTSSYEVLILPDCNLSGEINEFFDSEVNIERTLDYETGHEVSDSYEIRDYQVQDSLHRIHQKLSYKLKKPMVKVFAKIQRQSFNYFLDLSGEKEVIEKTLATFYGIASLCIKNDIEMRVHWSYETFETIQNNQDLIACFWKILGQKHDDKTKTKPQEDAMFYIHDDNINKITQKVGGL